ncbi:hypothetical protein [Saccharolobus islandicus]|uniref:Plasmid pARN4 n=1 Tax=Saccharolobus islandicus (strain L.D.8.5 / Lassen \|nr:hypothetical protein [Sulfolobus islandicus]ADB87820.1 hypothetical protein LD85_2172 [Sulfolobus islandicus L.D.8.5]
MNLVQLIEKVAKKYNIKINSLPNGVIILIKNDIGYVQIAAVRNVYYVRYLTKNEAYIIHKLNEETIEMILEEKLDETEALKIPDV